MVDQKLVGELEKALTDEAYDGGMGALSGEEFAELVRTLAVTAADVVEKAHTPTDDERGVIETIKTYGHLAAQVMVFQGDTYPVKAIPYTSFLHILDGFRRSEVPEPSDQVKQLLRDMTDPDDCWFDHHGGCQAHGYLSLQPGETCPHAEAKELLASWAPVKQEGAETDA